MSAINKPECTEETADQPVDSAGWSFGYGKKPHRIYARELLAKGGVIQAKWTDPKKAGRDKRARHHLHMPLRKRPGGPVDPKLERLVQRAIIAANARLVAGLPPFDEPDEEAPSDRSAGDATPETLTIAEGFELALHPETGKYATTDSRRYDDMLKLRDMLFEPGMIDRNLRWVDLKHEHVVTAWRRMASVHKKHPERFGVRRAEVVIDALYVVAKWLRLRSKISTHTAQPADGWRKELQSEWAAITGREVHEPYKPRHTVEEALAIFRMLWHPERERFRALLPVAKDGAVQALHLATRECIVRDEAGRPAGLRLRITRDHRDPTREAGLTSVRIHLDDAARAAVSEVDNGAPDAQLFTLSLEALTIDPRAELLTELGAELRQGQVLRCKRSYLSFDSAPETPYGRLTVPGRGKKRGETLALTAEQRTAIERALTVGHLALAEAAYDPKRPETDFFLTPAGRLVGGRVPVDRARLAPITRAAALEKFHELERAAGVTPVDGRGWYGLRRIATDQTPKYTSDHRVLDRLGAWTPGSLTRVAEYQNGQDADVLRETVHVRAAWRANAEPTKAAPGTAGITADALLAALPDELRAAVVASLLQTLGQSAVGTAVGTNDDAPAGESDEGVVSA